MRLTSHLGDRPLVIREWGEEEPRPDTSSEWDDWDDDWLPEELTPVHHRAAIEVAGDVVGSMSWHAVQYGPTWGSCAWSMGIALVPSARGHGIGSVCQRLLSDHLLLSAFRVEASTDIDNVAEQRSLEKAGFAREGVLHGAQFRSDGVHHALVMYARTRSTLER